MAYTFPDARAQYRIYVTFVFVFLNFHYLGMSYLTCLGQLLPDAWRNIVP